MRRKKRSENKVIQWEATRIFFENLNAKKSVVINIGGARSSKTYSILQLFLYKFITEKDKRFLICRKSLPSLKRSVLLDWEKKILPILGNNREFIDINKQNLFYEYKLKNNLLMFASIDETEKFKSTEFNYIFMEEANEFDYDDYKILKLRLSAPHGENEINQIFLAMNPISCWVNEILMNVEDCEIIKSTYKDAIKFLPEDYVRELEKLQYIDEEYWKIYGLGEFTTLSNIIYTNYEIIPETLFPKDDEVDDIFYGLDFGYNNPTALIEIRMKDGVLYERELLYQTNLTNSELIDLLKQLIVKKTSPIYADPSEPARIEEIYKAGYNIIGAEKSVKDGIDFVKRQKIKIANTSSNLIKEKKNYKWKVDKNNNVLDEPVKFNDHLMDAERYAIYTHLKDRVSFEKSKFEIYFNRITEYDEVFRL